MGYGFLIMISLFALICLTVGAMGGWFVGFVLKPRLVYVPVTGDIIRAITDANQNKHHSNLNRRILKLSEELGEAAEAFLNVTSAANGKKKTWADVREELADLVIVAVDCALTPTPDQVEKGLSRENIEFDFNRVVGTKLAKWKSNRDTGKAATDAE